MSTHVSCVNIKCELVQSSRMMLQWRIQTSHTIMTLKHERPLTWIENSIYDPSRTKKGVEIEVGQQNILGIQYS